MWLQRGIGARLKALEKRIRPRSMHDMSDAELRAIFEEGTRGRGPLADYCRDTLTYDDALARGEVPDASLARRIADFERAHLGTPISEMSDAQLEAIVNGDFRMVRDA